MFGVGKNDNGMYVNWISLSYSIQYYHIYRAASSAGTYVKIENTTQNDYTDIRGTDASFYKVSSLNLVESDLSSPATLNATNFTVTLSASQGSKTNMIDISWTPVSDAIAYRLYRTPTDSFDRNSTRIAEVIITSYTDNVQSDSIYYYKITILKSTGESGFATITTPGYRYPSTKPYPTPAYFQGFFPPKFLLAGIHLQLQLVIIILISTVHQLLQVQLR
jgi:fibronectin type 3 domain-containing protein